jgi:hypothetical protein
VAQVAECLSRKREALSSNPPVPEKKNKHHFGFNTGCIIKIIKKHWIQIGGGKMELFRYTNDNRILFYFCVLFF